MKCVVLIRPTSENIRLLAKEIANPRYGSYFVYFTNRASKADLKTLAESDGNEVVGDVKEIPSDFLVFDSHVFTVKVMSPIKNLRWNQTNSALNRCTDGIRSLMLALKGTRANICWAKDDQKMTLCQELAQGIKTEIASDGHPGDTLIGKKHALKKYDQFTLNTSSFWEVPDKKLPQLCNFTKFLLQK